MNKSAQKIKKQKDKTNKNKDNNNVFIIEKNKCMDTSIMKYISIITSVLLIFILLYQSDEVYAMQPLPQEIVVEDPIYRHEESFKKDHYIDGVFAEMNEYFYVGDWDIKNSLLTIHYNVTPLVDQYLSNVTIAINGTRVHSGQLIYKDGGRQYLKVNIPKAAFKEGINRITLESYIRTEEGEPCVDDVSTASWMNIFKESSIAMTYKSKATMTSIADFHKEFTSINALEQKQSIVATPTHASNIELATSLTALGGIANNAILDYENIKFMPVDDFATIKDKKYILYLSELDHLPQSLAVLLNEEQKSAAAQGAILSLVVNEQGQNILLVVGANHEAMIKSAKLLGNKDTMEQLQNTYKFVDEKEDVRTRKPESDLYTILTSTGTYVKGAFRRSSEFYISHPKNRMIVDGSQVYLEMRYSENLDFDKSLVTVYINDQPIGSKKLTKENANGDELLLDIPMDLKISGNFVVKVAFDLSIKDLWCTLREEEMPWAFISNQSMLKMNTIENPFLVFENYPAPFVVDGKMNEIAVVVPDNISVEDYDVLGPLFLTLGRHINDNEGNVKVVRASEQGDLSENHIIMIGTYKDNKAVKAINNKLFFKFGPKGEAILSNEKQLINLEYSRGLGTVQLIRSPHAPEHQALLLISGVNRQGMLQASSYLGSTANLGKIYGDGYIADDEEVKSYRFKEDNKKVLSFEEKVQIRKDRVPMLMAIVGILSLLGVMGGLLFMKYRKGNKDEK